MTTKSKVKSKPKSKPKPRTKSGGAKPGNQNARKHGLWAKNHPKMDQKAALGPQRRVEILDSIIDDLHSKYFTAHDLDTACKMANAISIAVTAANGCDRTIALLTGKLPAIDEALARLFEGSDPYDNSTIE